jgi:hypothetical protein
MITSSAIKTVWFFLPRGIGSSFPPWDAPDCFDFSRTECDSRTLDGDCCFLRRRRPQIVFLEASSSTSSIQGEGNQSQNRGKKRGNCGLGQVQSIAAKYVPGILLIPLPPRSSTTAARPSAISGSPELLEFRVFRRAWLTYRASSCQSPLLFTCQFQMPEHQPSLACDGSASRR